MSEITINLIIFSLIVIAAGIIRVLVEKGKIRTKVPGWQLALLFYLVGVGTHSYILGGQNQQLDQSFIFIIAVTTALIINSLVSSGAWGSRLPGWYWGIVAFIAVTISLNIAFDRQAFLDIDWGMIGITEWAILLFFPFLMAVYAFRKLR